MENVKTTDEYISKYPDNVKAILLHIRSLVKTVAPQAVESIKYGIPTFELNGNLLHYAAYKKHIGFYPSPSGINAFKKRLAKYKFSKGAVQFPVEKPIPFDLIKDIVTYRVLENTSNLN